MTTHERLARLNELDKKRTPCKLGVETFAINNPRKGSVGAVLDGKLQWYTGDIPIDDARFLASASEALSIANELQAQLDAITAEVTEREADEISAQVEQFQPMVKQVMEAFLANRKARAVEGV